MADSEKVSSLPSERAVLLRAMAEKWHDEETLGDSTCDYREIEIHAYIAGYSAASSERQELLDCLKRLLQVFPTDDDMTGAGWNHSEVSDACMAYDVARAVYLKATGEQQ